MHLKSNNLWPSILAGGATGPIAAISMIVIVIVVVVIVIAIVVLSSVPALSLVASS